MIIRIATIALLFVVLLGCRVGHAEEPSKPPAPVATPAPAPMPEMKPGDVLQVQKDSGLQKLDMNKFYVLNVEWQGPTPSGIEYGLRSDNVVVWRRVTK